MHQIRGRSRQVSHTALARQASEERRVPPHRSIVPRAQPLSLPEHPSSNEKSALVSDFKPITVPSPARVIISEKPITTPAPLKAPSRPTLVATTSPPPLTSASMSPDYYDSPPSPPQSLVDQVHVAYALDDIHLAKVLLLRLKGIKVTSDDDPRIAAVKDEDFDFCFVPHGRLMDDEDEKRLLERQKAELEMIEEKRREDRLKACERIWVQEKRRLREATELARRKRELEAKQAEERVRIRKEKAEAAFAERRRATRPRTPVPQRSVVLYKIATPPSSSSRASESFVYDVMVAPVRPIPSRTTSLKSITSTPSKPKSTSPFSRPLFDDSRAVLFSDVLASMQGPLFPPQRRPISPISSSQSQDRRRRRDAELLDSLLKVVEWEEDERRRRKGKGPERPLVQRKNSNKSVIACAACSSPSSSSSSPSSSSSSSLSPTPSRRSWLSFSSVSSSASTAATTPSTSPAWLDKSTSPIRKRPNSWFGAPSSNHMSLSISTPPLPHSCKSCTHLTPISLAESPLTMPLPTSHTSYTASNSNNTSPFQTSGPRGLSGAIASGSLMIRRVSQFLEFAKGFQNAYMNATLFSMPASSDSFEDQAFNASFVVTDSWQARKCQTKPCWTRPRPSGQRACSADVAAFLNPSTSVRSYRRKSTAPAKSSAPHIPLRLLNVVSDDVPRTILPDPLPYPIVFKPLPIPCRSPFRIHAHAHVSLANDTADASYCPTPALWTIPAHGGAVVVRVRTVENPFYLRLKALHNVVRAKGACVQSRAREGTLAAGREKVLQIAFEGIGRSVLGIGSPEEVVAGRETGRRGGEWW